MQSQHFFLSGQSNAIKKEETSLVAALIKCQALIEFLFTVFYRVNNTS